jgi:aspartate ammonia-lyase
MASRTYTADIAGGTATVTIQIQANATISEVALNCVSAAAGSYEVSLNPLSQIGTAQPTSDVIGRMRVQGAAGWQQVQWNVRVPVKAFQNVYVHCTGAGNVGEAMLIT